jgi:hypothetical protein
MKVLQFLMSKTQGIKILFLMSRTQGIKWVLEIKRNIRLAAKGFFFFQSLSIQEHMYTHLCMSSLISVLPNC